MAERPSPSAAPSPARRPDPPASPPRWHSEQLFGSHHEIQISHGGSVYRLRKTSLGKLILTK